MEDSVNLVADLALILISAGVFTIISKALKQPLVLGYIIAGLLVGPHVGLFPTVTHTETVEQWSEIGIIFMMFGLGLEFSFKKLLQVGSSALIIAGCKFIGLFIMGFATGLAMRWTTMESVFLGGLLSMSSTAVVLKAYDDMGLKRKPFAGTVFGTLVIEDIIAILLMVVFSTVAVSKQFEGGEMLFNFVKLFFFLILWFLTGIYLIPTIFRKAKKYLNDEILLIVSIGLCFGMVALANAVGFSSALGAFVMGSILAETLEGEHIIKLTGGIKDLFSAIFFVSVGMMIDPKAIAEHWLPILIITLLVIIGHIVFSAGGAILARKDFETAVKTGFSLSQLGEFGFILAGVGVGLGVMRGFTYPVIVAVSVITTFTTPYMIKLSVPAEKFLRRKLPANWIERIDSKPDSGKAQTTASKAEWKAFATQYLIRTVLYSVILFAIILGARHFLTPLTGRLFKSLTPKTTGIINAVFTLLVMSPFLYGIGTTKGRELKARRNLKKMNAPGAWSLDILIVLKALIAMVFVLFAIVAFIEDIAGWVVPVVLVVGAMVFLTVRKSLKKMHIDNIEKRFFNNLNAKEDEARRAAPVTTSVQDKMAGYDVHIEPVVVSPNSTFAGRRLKDIPFRSETGVNIVKMERGRKSILVPKGDEMVFPYDRLLAVGTGEQLAAFRTMVAASQIPAISSEGKQEFVVETITIAEDSEFCGKALKEAGLREHGCMVISLLRGDDFITNPKPDLRFQVGDTVWIAGERDSVEWFR